MRRNRGNGLRRLVRRRQARRVLGMARVGWRDADANHGRILMRRRSRPAVCLVGHVATRGRHASVLVLGRHAVVLLRRRVRVVLVAVARVHVVHLWLRLLLLLVILRHIRRLPSSRPSAAVTGGRVHLHGHAAATVYVLPSRQMVAVTHPAGVGYRWIRIVPNGCSRCELVVAIPSGEVWRAGGLELPVVSMMGRSVQ